MYRIIEMSSGDESKSEIKELIDKIKFNTYAKHMKHADGHVGRN